MLALVGEMDDAAAVADRARSLTLPADASSALYWRSAKALVHAARGEGEKAARLAVEIESLVAGIEHPIVEFDGRLDAAEAWRAGGDRARAEALLRRAVADSEARGANALARRASDALEELTRRR
jgi:ATP/maltotriose-dependent transcriptional regulator MalT